MNAIKKFLKDESGPTAVEYAVMLALILVVCIGAVRVMGQNLNNTYDVIINGTIEAAKQN